MSQEVNKVSKTMVLAVVASSLGFFVDLYDIIIVSVVRQASLLSLGVPESELLSKGIWLLNIQMIGMLTGGFLWGILGDKKGRLTVLFGSILMYSLATFACAYAPSYDVYLLLRFVAGVGLAGELGAAITLTTELLPQKYRGIGPAIIASFGMLGAIFGSVIGGRYSWEFTYQLGGIMGLVLLFLRLGLLESGFYERLQETKVEKGNFLMLVKNKKLFKKYISVILMGFPGWFVNGVVMTFTPEIAKAMGMTTIPKVSTVFMVFFIGFTFGDFSCGMVSQWLQSRKKAIQLYLGSFALLLALYFLVGKTSEMWYYGLFLFMGISAGYTIVLLTLAAEQTGTNLRATATTSSLNLLRASVIPQTIAFTFFNNYVGAYHAAIIVGILSVGIAAWAYTNLEETFHNNLDFVEQ
ncbi:MAG: MFS transporter [Saprospiraceae bacterium]|jgi:putative MFS transporter|nr:MFS transporter [Saprospiraceae bacterium]